MPENRQDQKTGEQHDMDKFENKSSDQKQGPVQSDEQKTAPLGGSALSPDQEQNQPPQASHEHEEGAPSAGYDQGRPIERGREGRAGTRRGTAAMDESTRKEVARKGGLAVSRNRQHMSEIGRKGGQSVSKNREHMAAIGRKGGAASRGHRGSQ